MNLTTSNHLEAYVELKRRVREALVRGRERAQDAVEREKVRTSWEIGRLIHEHILLHKERADYGKQVIKRLSVDLAISNTELYYMVEFARTYPNFRTSGNLSWAHYQALLGVNDPLKREALAGRAVKENWPVLTLRREIKKNRLPSAPSDFPTDEPLIPIKGRLDTYRIVPSVAGMDVKTVLDLGFSNYLSLGIFFPRRWPQESRMGRRGAVVFKEKDIVQVSKEGKLTLVKDATEADLFTYRAYVLEITDGDTLWVVIDLGFGFFTKQQLRLRGLDAPEIASRDGQHAKRFVQSQLKNIPSVIIASTKSDKYDRSLADVFYKPETKGGEQFLNNRLLKERLAERV